LKKYLKSQLFSKDIRVIEKADRMITGNFEVTLIELDNKLIHSNRRGMGRCTNQSDWKAIADHIERGLAEL
jgi:hypothetical protein